jgi:hypothetical protein
METTSNLDRRHQRRAKIDLLVNRFLNGHPYMCRMTDISRTGARIVPLSEPRLSPAPSHMGLQFQLPGRDEVVTASGVAIVGSSARTVGVQFTNLPPDSALVIDAFMKAA